MQHKGYYAKQNLDPETGLITATIAGLDTKYSVCATKDEIGKMFRNIVDLYLESPNPEPPPVLPDRLANEKDFDLALAMFEPLHHRKRTPEESQAHEHLVASIVRYEQEDMLLQEISKGIPKELTDRYEVLAEKRDEETLTEEEYKELIEICSKIEWLEVDRTEALAQLSEIRQVPLLKLMDDLNIQPAKIR